MKNMAGTVDEKKVYKLVLTGGKFQCRRDTVFAELYFLALLELMLSRRRIITRDVQLLYVQHVFELQQYPRNVNALVPSKETTLNSEKGANEHQLIKF